MQRGGPGTQHLLSLLAAFVAASTVLGVLAAGLVMPATWGVGATATAAIGTFDALPSELDTPVMAQQTRILANDGVTELGKLAKENRTVVPLSEIAPVMRAAQIAIEDDRFYEHGGVDTRGIARALVSTLQGNKQGASTITQQYVKQSLIAAALANDNEEAAQAAQEQRGMKGIIRKLQEAKFAMELEKKKSKDQILESYLNLVFYGANAYGVEAAAQRYFSVHAKDLTLPQAAMIAGLAQLPDTYDPTRNAAGALARRNVVLDRMAAVGAASKADVAAAKATPLGLRETQPVFNCAAAMDKWTCMYVKSWVEQNVTALGADDRARRERLERGGFTITTTIDAQLTKETRRILTDWISPDADNLGTSSATVEPGTGKVLAIGQSSAENNSVIWSVDTKYGVSGGFAIGSTAKAYAVATALGKGMTANTMINAPRDGVVYPPGSFDAGRCESATNDPWKVVNVEGTVTGWMSLRSATVYSLNTAFTELASRIGVCDTKALMADMGLHTAAGEPYGNYPNSIILGAQNASPLTMAASYATFAAGGRYCEPYPVEKITTFDGKEIEVPKGQCHDTKVTPRVAYNTTDILKGVAAQTPLAGGRPAAAKTGTNDGSSSLWQVGYTPQRATAVWSGRPGHLDDINELRLGGRYIYPVYGYAVSGPSWKKIMDAAHRDLPVQQFTMAPPRKSADGKVTIPDLRGIDEQEARQMLQDAGLSVQINATRRAEDGLTWGQVVSSDPGAGSQVDQGSTVTLTLASGYNPNSNRRGNQNNRNNNRGNTQGDQNDN